MKRGSKTTTAISSVAALATLMLGTSTVFAQTTSASHVSSATLLQEQATGKVPLTKSQRHDKAYIKKVEDQAFANFKKTRHIIKSSDAKAQGKNDLQKHIAAINKKLKTQSFQNQITQDWRKQHSNSTTTVAGKSSQATMQPNFIPPQQGDWYIGTNGNSDQTMITDGNTQLADYQKGLTITLTIGSFFTEGASALVLNVINALNLVPWQESDGASAKLMHSLWYNYKDLYIYNGSAWVDCFTTDQVLWYHHDYAQYLDVNGYMAQRTMDYTPSNGYSAIHTLDASYYGDTKQQIYNEGHYYYVKRQHGYNEVYGS